MTDFFVQKPPKDVMLDINSADTPPLSCGSPRDRTNDRRSSSVNLPTWLVVTWLVFTTLVAVAALILAAYATSQRNAYVGPTNQALSVALAANQTANAANQTANDSQGNEPVALVTQPAQAENQGWTVRSSVWAGTGYWSIYAPLTMPDNGRADHGTISHQGYIYSFGGSNVVNNQTVTLNTMNKYNMYAGKVERLANMPEPRTRFAYAIMNNNIYVLGGLSADNSTTPVGSIMIYNIDNDSWAVKNATANLMKHPRCDFAGASVTITNGYVYAIGGFERDASGGLVSSAVVERLDLTTWTWSQAPSLRTARADLAAHNINGTLYVFGGALSDEDSSWTDAVEALTPSEDVAAGSWQRRASMPYAIGEYASELLPNGNVLVAGGEGNYSFQGATKAVVPWVNLYISSLDVWVPKAAMSDARIRFDLASDNNSFVYAFGGAKGCDDTADEASECTEPVQSTILGYYDNQYPNVWVSTTPDDVPVVPGPVSR